MNYGRLVLAALVATVVDAVYGYVVYGVMLGGAFAQYPGVFRPAEVGNAYLPGMFVGILVALCAAAFIYAKGYDGGGGLGEGLRFGILLGVVDVGYYVGVNYAILNIGRRLAASLAAAGFVEWLVVGVVIGALYHGPAASPKRRAAGV